jgi:hypothetical protein
MLALVALTASIPAGCDDQSGTAATPPVTPPGAGATPAAASTTTAPPPAATAAAPAANPVSVGNPDGAQITFAEMRHDFGVINDTERYQTSFRFTNTGRARLEIAEVKAACGCTVPTLAKKVYMPGESGEIKIVFDPKGKQGITEKQITVISNIEGGTTELWLTSDIKPLMAYERMHRLGTLALGQEHRSIIPMRFTDPNLTIKSVSVNNPNLSVSVIEPRAVESSGSEVTYRADIELVVHASAPWGVVYATRVTVNVNGRPRADATPVNYAYDVFVVGDVFGELRGRPAIISMGPMPAGTAFEKSSLITRPSGVPFEITDVRVVESTMPDVQARIDTRGAAAHAVVVYGNTGGFRGPIKGRLLLTTSVEGEENLELRFSGLVR